MVGILLFIREYPLRRIVLAAALIPCALVLTACGSSATTVSVSTAGASASASGPSNAGLSQAQLLARFKTALAAATAIHFKGTMSGSGSTFSIDMQLNKDGSAQGTTVSGGMTIPLIAIGGVTYVQVTSSLESMIKSEMTSGGDAAESALVSEIAVGKWISSKSAIGSTLSGGFGDMTDFSSMTKNLASGTDDKFTYLGTSTLNGQAVAQYKDVSTNDGSSSTATMDVPLYGSPLPIKEDAGSQGGMNFTWNQPTKVSAPAASDILDLPTS